MLINGTEDLIHKVAGGSIREAGKKNKPELISFLSKHAAIIPSVSIHNAIEN